MFDTHSELTHVFLLVDDYIYNPEWYCQLTELIERTPEGIAWTVYKSSNTKHHKIIGDKGGYKLVTSISGTGALSRSEFEDYHPYTMFDFTVPQENGGGCTLDLHHSYVRPGLRFATSIDYIDHIGVDGINCKPNVPEHAVNFIGE